MLADHSIMRQAGEYFLNFGLFFNLFRRLPANLGRANRVSTNYLFEIEPIQQTNLLNGLSRRAANGPSDPGHHPQLVRPWSSIFAED